MTERFGTTAVGQAAAPMKFAARPGFGSRGREVQLRVNMFEMKQFPKGIIYQYDVVMVPDVPPSFARVVFSALESQYVKKSFGGILPVYDGRKAMYAARPIPGIGRDPQSFKVDVKEESGEARPLSVNVKLVAEINMHALQAFIAGETETMQAQEAIQALDIILRHSPAMKLSIFGRSLFSPENRQRLGGGIDAWKGFFQSVRPASKRLLVNIDTSATAYYQSGPVLDVLVDVLGRRDRQAFVSGLSEMERMKAERFFKGTKVEVNYHEVFKRRYRVLGVTRETADTATFYNESIGRNQTVAEFFQTTHEVRLVFHSLPCFRVGNPQRNIMIPMELCSLVGGQRYPRKLNDLQTAEMIKFTAQRPQQRAAAISSGLNMLQYSPDNPYLKQFEISVSTSMLQVPGRILPAPRIDYGGRDPTITPRDGGWNLRGKRLLSGRQLNGWVVICFGSQRDFPLHQIQQFITEFVRHGNETGLPITMAQPPIYHEPPTNISNTLLNSLTRGEHECRRPIQMIMCVLPGKRTHPYGEIKRISDTVLGIPTQCVQGSHTRRPNPQYIANVCLKMNAKLGGVNSKPTQSLPVIGEAPTIVFGADVSHPAPGETGKPSICAVVASVDQHATKYVSSVAYQGSRVEHILELEAMVKGLLVKFYRQTGVKPKRIIFYRDGLSEGQFGGVALAEISSVKRALASLDNIKESEVLTPITYIAVQKRHHVRMFPMPNEGDRNGNVLPGTVIDTEITHPNEFNFYMCSHGSLLGTARPTHYYVLVDENGLSADTVQKMTYEMCYLFCRATRAVSICPPVYYADILAYRARFHTSLEWEESFSGDRASSVISESSFAPVIAGLENVMYFV